MNRSAGQAVTEYILLLAILVSLFSTFLTALMDTNALNLLKKPLETDFKYTYQYGHPKARGQENGGPLYIPQYSEAQNFRIFINPPISE